jgi:hypothetical protein
VDVSILFSPSGPRGTQTYNVRFTEQIEPLYDIDVSPLRFDLTNDCDAVGKSELRLAWAYAHGRDVTFRTSMRNHDTAQYREVGQSRGLKVPNSLFDDEDPGGFYARAAPGTEPLPLGTNRKVNTHMSSDNNDSCTAQIRYSITFELRKYPDLN